VRPRPRRALLTRAGREQYGEILASREKHEALDARAAALAGLLQGARTLALQTSLPSLVATAQRLAAGVVRCDAAAVFVHDAANDALFTFLPTSNGAGSRRVSVPASDASVAGVCFAAGEALRVPDVYADPRFARQRAALVRGDDAAPGPCAMLCVPVRRESGSKGASPVLAVVQLVRDSAQGSEPFEPFSPVDAQRVQDFAQACPALGALPLPSPPLPSPPAGRAAGRRLTPMGRAGRRWWRCPRCARWRRTALRTARSASSTISPPSPPRSPDALGAIPSPATAAARHRRRAPTAAARPPRGGRAGPKVRDRGALLAAVKRTVRRALACDKVGLPAPARSQFFALRFCDCLSLNVSVSLVTVCH
jgi:hypothetical protein